MKGINKTLSTSGFSSLLEVELFILSARDVIGMQNPWVRERVIECRRSLAVLDFA